MIKKSTRMYRTAFFIGLLFLPFVIIVDREILRNLWIMVPLGIALLSMIGCAFYALHLEEQGQ